MQRLAGDYYRAHGRVDDTMNLGGIKTSSASIERVCDQIDGVRETAAVAINPADGGPSQLVLYVVPESGPLGGFKEAAQAAIKHDLNPLFRVHDVVEVDSLPRTASNKVMRRVLRSRYAEAAKPVGSDAS